MLSDVTPFSKGNHVVTALLSAGDKKGREKAEEEIRKHGGRGRGPKK